MSTQPHISTPPSASTITVRQVLGLLDGPFEALAESFSRGEYVLWLGSGISRDKVDDLKRLIERILGFMQQRIEPSDANCRFRRGLYEAINLAQLSDEQQQDCDFSHPVNEWPFLNVIVDRLVERYSQLLNIQIDGEAPDFLLWEAVDVYATYADPEISPDCEHLCIAILTLEGIISEVATANWDALIEKALMELGNYKPKVCVSSIDIREANPNIPLYKFHGCAVRAKEDPDNYRAFLVARQPQIDSWAAQQENEAYIGELISLLRRKRTLMIGLSAQDHNIRSLFSKAQAHLSWPWPSIPPACVFSGSDLNHYQRALLENIYGSAYTTENRPMIFESSLIKAYAKPLLSAILLYALYSKFCALAKTLNLGFENQSSIQDGLKTIRDMSSETINEDYTGLVREVIRQISRILTTFRSGNMTDSSSGQYSPISTHTLNQIGQDPNITASGLPQLSAAFGILGYLIKQENWSISPVGTDEWNTGVIELHTPNGRIKLYFLADDSAALKLTQNQYISDQRNTILIHSKEIASTQQRSPRIPPGRTGEPSLRSISIANLLQGSQDFTEIIKSFREEAVL